MNPSGANRRHDSPQELIRAEAISSTFHTSSVATQCHPPDDQSPDRQVLLSSCGALPFRVLPRHPPSHSGSRLRSPILPARRNPIHHGHDPQLHRRQMHLVTPNHRRCPDPIPRRPQRLPLQTRFLVRPQSEDRGDTTHPNRHRANTTPDSPASPPLKSLCRDIDFVFANSLIPFRLWS